MTLDASGNLGLGVTPSAWSGKAIDVSGYASFATWNNATGVVNNGFYNSSSQWIYKNTAAASAYYQVSGQHVWQTAASGTAGNAITFTQAMTLDASGNLGVGTTSPSTKLHTSAYAAVSATIDRTGDFGESLQFVRAGVSGSASLGLANDNTLGMYTAGTERARIDSSGNLLVGTTSANGSGGLTVTPQGQGSNTPAILGFNKTASGNYYAAQFRHSGTIVGSIEYSDTATSYVTSSDYRLKDNIAPMTGALAKVAALKPVTYKWKADGSDGEGFIAHELAAVVPQAVTGQKDAVDEEGNPVYQGIDTSFLVATLTAAIQELKAEVDSLKAQLEGKP